MKETFEQQAKQAVGREIFCGKSLNNLVATFSYTGEKSAQDILDDIKFIWHENGFVHPSDMHKMLIETSLPQNSDLAEDLLNIEEALKALDKTSHYMRKDQAPILSSLAHLYALENPDKDIAIFESDAINLGGTNYELFIRALQESGYSNDERFELLELLELSVTDSQEFENVFQTKSQNIKDKYDHISSASYSCADEAIRIMALNAAHAIEKHGGHIFPARAGGDEFRIIALGIKPEQHQQIVDEIHDTQTRILEQLNLTRHIHLKKPDTQCGAGFAVVASNLHDIKPASYQENSEAKIVEAKQKLIQTYKQKQPKKISFSKTNERLIELRRALLSETEYHREFLPELKSQPANVDSPPFTLPHIKAAQKLIQKRQHEPTNHDDYTQHVVNETIQRIIPIDSSTGLHMPLALEHVLTDYNHDAAMLAKKINRPDLKANLITIDISNLGGLNKALTQKGADKLLENAGEIITNALEENGIDPENGAHSVHCGNGLCMIALPPVIVKPNGQYTQEDLLASEKIKRITQTISADVLELNNQTLDDFIAQNGLNLEEDNKKITSQFQHVGELPSAHTSRSNKGIGITISRMPVNLTERMGAATFIDHMKQPQNRHPTQTLPPELTNE